MASNKSGYTKSSSSSSSSDAKNNKPQSQSMFTWSSGKSTSSSSSTTVSPSSSLSSHYSQTPLTVSRPATVSSSKMAPTKSHSKHSTLATNSKKKSVSLQPIRGQHWKSFSDLQTKATLDELNQYDDEYFEVPSSSSSVQDDGSNSPSNSTTTRIPFAMARMRTQNNVMRLDKADMNLYGLYPETDRFSAIVCSICGAVVKPQGLAKHMAAQHQNHHSHKHYSHHHRSSSVPAVKEKSTSSHSSLLHDIYGGSNSNDTMTSPAAMAVPAQSVSNTKNFLGSAYYVRDLKTTDASSRTVAGGKSSTSKTSTDVSAGRSSKSRQSISGISSANSISKSKSSSSSSSSSKSTSNKSKTMDSLLGRTKSDPTSMIPHSMLTAHVSLPILSASALSTATATRPTSSMQSISVTASRSPPSPAPSNASSSSSTKAYSQNRRRGSAHKKSSPPTSTKNSQPHIYNPNRHCGVHHGEPPRPCTRSLSCKTHSLALRRQVKGRRSSFDQLLADHRQSSKGSKSSAANSEHAIVIHDNSSCSSSSFDTLTEHRSVHSYHSISNSNSNSSLGSGLGTTSGILGADQLSELSTFDTILQKGVSVELNDDELPSPPYDNVLPSVAAVLPKTSKNPIVFTTTSTKTSGSWYTRGGKRTADNDLVYSVRPTKVARKDLPTSDVSENSLLSQFQLTDELPATSVGSEDAVEEALADTLSLGFSLNDMEQLIGDPLFQEVDEDAMDHVFQNLIDDDDDDDENVHDLDYVGPLQKRVGGKRGPNAPTTSSSRGKESNDDYNNILIGGDENDNANDGVHSVRKMNDGKMRMSDIEDGPSMSDTSQTDGPLLIEQLSAGTGETVFDFEGLKTTPSLLVDKVRVDESDGSLTGVSLDDVIGLDQDDLMIMQQMSQDMLSSSSMEQSATGTALLPIDYDSQMIQLMSNTNDEEVANPATHNGPHDIEIAANLVEGNGDGLVNGDDDEDDHTIMYKGWCMRRLAERDLEMSMDGFDLNAVDPEADLIYDDDDEFESSDDENDSKEKRIIPPKPCIDSTLRKLRLQLDAFFTGDSVKSADDAMEDDEVHPRIASPCAWEKDNEDFASCYGKSEPPAFPVLFGSETGAGHRTKSDKLSKAAQSQPKKKEPVPFEDYDPSQIRQWYSSPPKPLTVNCFGLIKTREGAMFRQNILTARKFNQTGTKMDINGRISQSLGSPMTQQNRRSISATCTTSPGASGNASTFRRPLNPKPLVTEVKSRVHRRGFNKGSDFMDRMIKRTASMAHLIDENDEDHDNLVIAASIAMGTNTNVDETPTQCSSPEHDYFW